MLLIIAFAMAPMAHGNAMLDEPDNRQEVVHLSHEHPAETCAGDACSDQVMQKCCAVMAGHCTSAAVRSDGWSTMPLFWTGSQSLPCESLLLSGLAAEAETPPPRL